MLFRARQRRGGASVIRIDVVRIRGDRRREGIVRARPVSLVERRLARGDRVAALRGLRVLILFARGNRKRGEQDRRKSKFTSVSNNPRRHMRAFLPLFAF